MYSISPISHHILTRLAYLNTESKIALPDGGDAGRPDAHGEVIAVGSDVKHFSVGDRVLYLPNNVIGVQDPETGENYHIVPEGAVFARYVQQTKPKAGPDCTCLRADKDTIVRDLECPAHGDVQT